MSNNKLSDDYVVIQQLGSGSFGEVFLAQYRLGGYVAIKIEERKKSKRIYNEYKIYRYLNKKNFRVGLPKIYDYLESDDYNIMVMQLLGLGLEDMFKKCNNKFTLATVYKIAIQVIELLEQVHKHGYIHRDVKPSNFLIGRKENKSQIFIMDFGLSKKYIINGKHINYRDNRSLIGTARYASIKMHMGIEPVRRDELESVGYMLVYFIKGVLPWQGVRRTKARNHLIKIGEIKMCESVDKLCADLPGCFGEYINYCRNLKFDATPDYKYMQNLFINSANKLNIKPEFEWC